MHYCVVFVLAHTVISMEMDIPNTDCVILQKMV